MARPPAIGRLSALTAGSRALLPQLLVGLAVTSCGGADAPVDVEGQRVIGELERLAFVARGETARGSFLDVGSRNDLVVDRYEVTWAQWLAGTADSALVIPDAFVPRVAPPPEPGAPAIVPDAWREEIPVTGVTLHEARAFAAMRGMRLPSFDEWMWCAAGSRSREMPAGRYQRGLANTLELGLFHSTPVGAFEGGKTVDSGIYDLVGNVWEWVDAPPRPEARLEYQNTEASWPRGRAPACCVGGSFLTRVPSLWTMDRVVAAMGMTPGHRGSDLGFRCVATAREYLAALPPRAALDTTDAERVRAVGQGWGRHSVRTLESLVEARRGLPWTVLLLAGARS